MENNKYLTTPEGKAIYPYLTHPDTEFKSEGLYHTKLECDQKDCQNLIKKIDDIIAQQVKLQHDQSPKKPIKKAPLPYEKTDDGKVIFNFKLNASGTRKDDGKTFFQKPVIVDAQKNEFTGDQIWGDSLLKITFEPYGWNMPIGIGCTLRLKAVQVNKLVTGKAHNSVLDGFSVGEQKPTEVREEMV